MHAKHPSSNNERRACADLVCDRRPSRRHGTARTWSWRFSPRPSHCPWAPRRKWPSQEQENAGRRDWNPRASPLRCALERGKEGVSWRRRNGMEGKWAQKGDGGARGGGPRGLTKGDDGRACGGWPGAAGVGPCEWAGSAGGCFAILGDPRRVRGRWMRLSLLSHYSNNDIRWVV